ncbi:MAG TPA: hypothetical protein VMU89_24945 [Thermomicrobiaceae bacterium]|nr:hypothetical protein [Thermomicrobiaceae bacterium]
MGHLNVPRVSGDAGNTIEYAVEVPAPPTPASTSWRPAPSVTPTRPASCVLLLLLLLLLNAGTKINFQGASGAEDFDQYHNVFGDWDTVQYNADALVTNVVPHVPADQTTKVTAAGG